MAEEAEKHIPAIVKKWFDVIEQRLPASGFTLGLPYLTSADLAILLMCKGSHNY
jgi:hypothetical protein